MTAANPFDDEDGRFYALRNAAGEFSLWPTFAEVPSGWTVVFGGAEGESRAAALAYVEREWDGPA